MSDVNSKLAAWRKDVDDDKDGCIGEAFIELLDIAERLARGEFICKSCGLRKDGETDGTPDF